MTDAHFWRAAFHRLHFIPPRYFLQNFSVVFSFVFSFMTGESQMFHAFVISWNVVSVALELPFHLVPKTSVAHISEEIFVLRAAMDRVI